MKKNRLLIFDLDDTIFETKSIGQEPVAPIFNHFKAFAKQFYSPEEITFIFDDLWQYPFDVVSNKFQFDELLNQQFSDIINSLEYQLTIEVFDDFKVMKNFQASKFLVTTGFRKLQLAKISALGLEYEFEKIIIDEIDSKQRKYKKGIFGEILETNEQQNQEVFVIGDNSESELKAGYELGLTTIQVAKLGQPKSKYATHTVLDFKELVELLD